MPDRATSAENIPASLDRLEKSLSQSSLVPSLARATEFSWNASIARARGVYGFNSMDARSRSFNLIRAKLVGLKRERNWRMLGIVSATPGVGKSFVSASLAAAMSRDPRFSTTLVDLDLRRGTVGQIFGMDLDAGLGNFLDSRDPLVELPAYRPEGEDLVIVPTVPANIHSAELLASRQAVEMFKSMRASDERNFFLVDLPPIYANDDAATTLDLLDGYLFIAEEGRTTQRELQSAIEILGHARLAGVVLNKYRSGLVSEGRGIEKRYASDYYAQESNDGQD